MKPEQITKEELDQAESMLEMSRIAFEGIKETVSRMKELFEKQEKEKNPDFSRGFAFISLSGSVATYISEPNELEMRAGQIFTTKERAQAFAKYHQACFNLRNACREHQRCGTNYSLGIGVIDGTPDWFGNFASPKWMCVDTQENAKRLATEHEADLRTVLNYNWEI